MIVHMTTVHYRDDSRIRDKQCASLKKEMPVPVFMLVQDGKPDEVFGPHQLPIVNTGPDLPRLKRMSRGAFGMIRHVLALKPKIVFFHDPELLPWAMLLKFFGIKVVYDAHEDYPEAVQHNTQLPKMARSVLPPFVRATEWIAGHWFDGILAPTEQIVRRFPPRKTHLIRNFPILSELIPPAQRDYADRPKQFAYVGGLTENRNIDGMMDGVAKLEDPDARLRLAGTFFPPSLEERILSKPEWERVIWDGWVSRQEVASLLGDARAGLVLLRPIEHEMLTLPIKMFEYMAAGLPVISSDFPLWRDIIEKAECGLLVDPMDVSAIAGAMQWILDHPDEAERMGQRGRAAIEEHYSWEAESRTLLSMTRTLLGEPGDGAHPKTPDAPESLVETP